MAPNQNTKWMNRLLKAETAVDSRYNPFAHVLRFSSPGVNFTFGNTHGIPRGYPIVVWGKNKAGKTILWYDLVGQMHKDDPEGWALRYDAEFKEEGQLTPQKKRAYGIDDKRYLAFMTNQPENIFDHFCNEIAAMCEDGLPLRAVCIDPLSNIQGRRSKNAEGVMTQQRGDRAATLQEGLSRMWPLLAKYRITLYLTCHARAEQDPVEQMRGKQIRMEAAWFVKHFGGYQMYVEAIQGAKGREGLDGNKLENESFKDAIGKASQTAHRVRVTMEGNSFGPKNRKAEFTFDDINGGVIQQHEEVFQLGTERRVILRPNNTTYVLPDYPAVGEEMTWRGKNSFLMALRTNEDIRQAVITRVRNQDIDLMELGTKSKFWTPGEEVDASKLDKDLELGDDQA